MLSYSTPYSGYSFAYDARDRQTEAFAGAIPTRWLINGLGQRVAQINVSVPEFYFVYDEAGHLTGKYDSNGNPVWETAWLGDLPVAVLAPAGNFYIAPDHLGSPHRITDASGAVVWQWHPDPFGNGAPIGAFPYELRFPGQYFDQATRLHYNYFRDYDPRTGRYIESDPIGLAGGINTYAYVGGNPVNLTDPLGLTDFGQGVGRAVEALYNCFKTCPECTPYKEGTIGYIGPHTDHDHYPIGRPHLNLYRVNQRKSDCGCFWNKNKPDAASPPPDPEWVDLNGGFPPLSP